MDQWLQAVMSGQRRGPAASGLRAALGLAEHGYAQAIGRRNDRFDRGIDVHTAAVPVVSVGNLTTGGTGKTPVVALVAEHYQRQGLRTAILSRGYRRERHHDDDRSGNDEARVLKRLCPNVPHRQQVDRVAGAAFAISQWQSDLLVMDDGFQHRRLFRDLDIVLIDATNPLGYGHLLPRGLLREPVTALRRADVVLLTRVDAVSPAGVAWLTREIQEHAPEALVAQASFPPRGLVNVGGERAPLEELEEVPVLAFCGIGNPAGFAATLRDAGLRAAQLEVFPDHHPYRPADWYRLRRRAEALGVGALVTTLKDLVKLDGEGFATPNLPLWGLETGCEIVANAREFHERLDDVVLMNRRHAA